MIDEKRIYVVIPAAVQVASGKYIQQPAGRQVAQACHAVSKLRLVQHAVAGTTVSNAFEPITTIVLQARDSAELCHVYELLHKKKMRATLFSDENKSAYGDFHPITAMAILATKKQVKGILDYLPLW